MVINPLLNSNIYQFMWRYNISSYDISSLVSIIFRVFPKPNEFDPDRFATNLPSAYYMPFGEGPRSCVGMRFALTLVKQTTVRLLQNYRVHLSKQLQASTDTIKNAMAVRDLQRPLFTKSTCFN